MLKIGMLGFGEAGYYLTDGMHDAEVYVYDNAAFSEGPRADLVNGRISEKGFTLCKDAKTLAEKADFIITFTSQKAAKTVAEGIASYLHDGSYYIDMNSTSPGTKKEIAAVFENSKGTFVEGAVMNAVPAKKSKVPINICCENCEAVAEALNGIGLNITPMPGKEIGSASTLKMLKSVASKGLAALLTEVVFTSEKYGLTDYIIDANQKSLDMFGGLKGFTEYVVTQAAYHNPRMASEMDEVIATLKELGENSIMATASRDKFNWLTEKGFREYFTERPQTVDEVIKAKHDLQAGE